jgi:branched-chain amino acid transport system substrate-binding protein
MNTHACKRVRAAGIGVIAITLSLIGCSGSTPSNTSATSTLKIGLIVPLTGPSAASGEHGKNGAQLAVDLANANNSLPGVHVELAIEDDKSTPETAVIAAQKLRNDGAQIITGTMNSSVAVALANALGSDTDALYLITGAQAQAPLDTQPGNNIFGLTYNNAQNADANLNWIKNVAKPKKIASVGENSDFGVNDLAQLNKYWGSGTPEIVLKETYDRTATDFSAILAKVRDSGADGLYVTAGSPTNAASIFTQADQLGLKVAKFMNAGLMNESLISAGGSHVEGLVSADTYNYSIDNAENKDFVKAFNDAYKKNPSGEEELGFDSVNLILQAAKKAGTTTDMAAVSSALKESTWNTPRGELTWDSTGRAHTAALIVGIKNGQIEIVDTVAKK